MQRPDLPYSTVEFFDRVLVFGKDETIAKHVLFWLYGLYNYFLIGSLKFLQDVDEVRSYEEGKVASSLSYFTRYLNDYCHERKIFSTHCYPGSYYRGVSIDMDKFDELMREVSLYGRGT